MIDSREFDAWAGDYDEAVRLADEKDEYPFAGYKRIMDAVYACVNERGTAKILDVGVGTGTLAAALYERGHSITGIDFSSEMLAIARNKMSGAVFYQCDFANGLPPEIAGEKYDFIISTYALHHLPDELKVIFVKSLLSYLDDNGTIIIGDIGFPTGAELNACREQNDDDWDDDEYYFVFSELADALKDVCSVSCEQISHCAGIAKIRNNKLEAAVAALIRAVGDDPAREGLADTPRRAAKMFAEMFAGVGISNDEIAALHGTTFPDPGTEMVLVKDIACFSFCEHHFALMYNMRAHIAYIPRGRVIGLSKAARIVDLVCKRFQLQERIGADIAYILEKILGTDDIMVVIEGEHSCMTARGIRAQGSATRTNTARGRFAVNADLHRAVIGQI